MPDVANGDVILPAHINQLRDGTAISATQISVDTLVEKTTGNGVVVDSIKLKDGNLVTTTATDHITITPGTNKLVKIAVYDDANGSGAYQNNTVILTGWGRVDAAGSAIFSSETVTFGITFSAAPRVICNATGGRAATATLATGFTENVFGNGSGISTTQFTATVQRGDSTNLQAAQYPYVWFAIGTL